MARKTREEALKTREAIIDAAIHLFADQGVFPTTLANIAEKAGVTRGAIYWHFKNKEDLLDCLYKQYFMSFEPLAKLIDEPEYLGGEEIPDVLSAIEQTHIAYFKSLKEDPRQLQLYQILVNRGEDAEGAPCHPSNRRYTKREGMRMCEILLRMAIKQGQLPENFNTRLGSVAVFSFCKGVEEMWIADPSLVDIDTDVPILFKGLTQMLRSSFNTSDNANCIENRAEIL